MKVLTFFFLVLLSHRSYGALPPYWDSVKKIQTVINDMSTYDKLDPLPIISIRELSELVFQVSTSRCTATVTMKPKPTRPGIVGPTEYSIEKVNSNCE